MKDEEAQPPHPMFQRRIDPGTRRSPANAQDAICRSCQWRIFGRISALVASIPPDFDDTLESILDSAVRLVRGERGFLMLADPDGQLQVRVCHGGEIGDSGFAPSQTVVQEVIQRRTGLALPNLPTNPGTTSQSVRQLGIRAVMCVPLLLQDRALNEHTRRLAHFTLPHAEGLLGVIYVDSFREAKAFDPYELDVLQALADQASSTLVASAYYHQAITDGLTGVLRSEPFRARLEGELGILEPGQELSLVIIDIDHFKQVNDQLGHATGDAVLARLGRLLRDCCTRMDAAGRLGGDEFALLLPGQGGEAAAAIAEELRSAMAAGLPPATISIGVVTHSEFGGNAGQLMEEADRRLYGAKRSGRNTVRRVRDSE